MQQFLCLRYNAKLDIEHIFLILHLQIHVLSHSTELYTFPVKYCNYLLFKKNGFQSYSNEIIYHKQYIYGTNRNFAGNRICEK